MAKRRSSRRRTLSEEERAEKRAAERELAAKAIEELRSSEGWQRWLFARRRLHRYSLANQLLIAFQCPGATYVTGFRRWLELGYAVRKGERGIRIWAPCPPSKEKIRKWKDEGADPAARPRTFFRLVAVFDRSQVDPLPEHPGGPVDLAPPAPEPISGESLAPLLGPLEGLASAIGYAFRVETIDGAAKGLCHRGERWIAVEEVREGFSPNAQIAVAVHELAHALVVVDWQEGDPKLSDAQEETVVECVAYTVCATLGLDTAGSSIPYMTGWSKGDEIERYAGLIDRLARRIEDTLLDAEAPQGAAGSREARPEVALAA